jgi:hypothetical protein
MVVVVSGKRSKGIALAALSTCRLSAVSSARQQLLALVGGVDQRRRCFASVVILPCREGRRELGGLPKEGAGGNPHGRVESD